MTPTLTLSQLHQAILDNTDTIDCLVDIDTHDLDDTVYAQCDERYGAIQLDRVEGATYRYKGYL